MNKLHLGPKTPTLQTVKDFEAAQLRADIEAFLAAGGEIEVLGNTNPLRAVPIRNKRGPKPKAQKAADNDEAAGEHDENGYPA